MTPRPLPPSPGSSVRNLAIIRIAILAGILVFGAVIWFMQREPDWAPRTPEFPVEPIALALWGAAIIGILLVRNAWGRTRDVPRRVHFSIIGIAIAEAPALFGAVVYFLTGDPRLYLTGVFLMLTTLLLFPISGHR